jgi:hypothetical protein
MFTSSQGVDTSVVVGLGRDVVVVATVVPKDKNIGSITTNPAINPADLLAILNPSNDSPITLEVSTRRGPA